MSVMSKVTLYAGEKVFKDLKKLWEEEFPNYHPKSIRLDADGMYYIQFERSDWSITSDFAEKVQDVCRDYDDLECDEHDRSISYCMIRIGESVQDIEITANSSGEWFFEPEIDISVAVPDTATEEAYLSKIAAATNLEEGKE